MKRSLSLAYKRTPQHGDRLVLQQNIAQQSQPPPQMPNRSTLLNNIVLNHEEDTSTIMNKTHWGIYTVIYDTPRRQYLRLGEIMKHLKGLVESAYIVHRLLSELYLIAPLPLLYYILLTVWQLVEPALRLHLSIRLLFAIEDGISGGYVDQSLLHLIISPLVLMAILSSVEESLSEVISYQLRGHLRRHFIPRLARVRLLSRVPSDKSLELHFPAADAFEDTAPGWDSLSKVSTKIMATLTLPFQLLTLVDAVMCRPTLDRFFLLVYLAVVPLIMMIAPSNCWGGFCFWTENELFKRLKALYYMIFSCEHRNDIITDCTAEKIVLEYQQCAYELGVVRDSVEFRWSCHPQWYWNLPQILLLQIPLVPYAASLSTSPNLSSLVSTTLLQIASSSLSTSFRFYRNDVPTWPKATQDARGLFNLLDHEDSLGDCSISSVKVKEKGMKIQFRNVSLQYEYSKTRALKDLNFDILPGQLILIVGVNGSGKSSMMKLISQLLSPTSGQVLIDGKMASSYDVNRLRSRMAIFSQHPTIYPLSISENIRLGLPFGKEIGEHRVIHAARRAGAWEMIQQLPGRLDMILNPDQSHSSWVSAAGAGYGEPSEALLDEMASQRPISVPLSRGQEQRLLASRTMFRLDNSDINLLIVDEPTSALDAVAESSLIGEFLKDRQDRTVILVTHRFGRQLAEQADMILCMNEGKIVEQGTHDALMTSIIGEYKMLFEAQRK